MDTLEHATIEQAIAVLDAQRAVLGDAVVETALVTLRQKLQPLAPKSTEKQRKQVTILFADISDFTPMSAQMDAEEVGETVDALWQILDVIITGYGGHIDKHIGDGLMAVFGTPVAREDDPERAIRAALQMQQALAEYTATLRMRIGIHTGPVFMSEIGSTGEYTAMGNTVNTASRLEQAAPVDGILVSHATYQHVRGLFNVGVSEAVALKGYAKKMQVYTIHNAKPRSFRVATRGVDGIETRTIGRDAELQQACADFRTMRDTRESQIVMVCADAGVGKSRLLYEFQNWLDLEPEEVWLMRGRCNPTLHALPYSLIRDILSFRFVINDSDSAAIARRKLEDGVIAAMPDDPAAREKAHFLGHLVGFDFSASPYLHGILSDARQIRERAFYYFAQLLETVAQRKPVVMLLEDVHWADTSSLDLLAAALETFPHIRVMLFATSRPVAATARHRWVTSGNATTHITLEPLAPDQCRVLVAEILQRLPSVPQVLTELIVSRAEGNPFFIEELIKMLLDDGVIVRTDDLWQVVSERLATLTVPQTLTGILQARLDGLSAEERVLAQCASVVGRTFWAGAVAHLQGRSSAGVAPILDSLDAKEIIHRRDKSAFAGTQEFAFKHALLHDVVYESVLLGQRKSYHAAVAQWLTEQSAERAGEYAGLIAEHYEKAGEPDNAADWYKRAAQQAQATGATSAALDYYRRQFGLSHPDAHSTILLDTVEVLQVKGDWVEALDVARRVLALANEADDLITQARSRHVLGRILSKLGNYADSLAQLVQAQHDWQMVDAGGLLPRATVQAEIAFIVGRIGSVYWLQGDYEAAQTTLNDSLKLARASGDKSSLSHVLNNLGNVASSLGDYVKTHEYYVQSLALRRELGDMWAVAVSLNNLGCVSTYMKDYDKALAYHKESLALSQVLGDKSNIVLSTANLGIVAYLQGDYAEAQAHLIIGARLWQEVGQDRLSGAVLLIGLAATSATTAQSPADYLCAARLCGTIQGYTDSSGSVFEPMEQEVYIAAVTAAQAGLNPDSYAAAFDEGCRTDLAKAFANLP